MVGAEADVRLKIEAAGREVEEREVDAEGEAAPARAKDVVVGRFEQTFAHIQGLFKSKAYTYLFVVLAIACVCFLTSLLDQSSLTLIRSFMSDFWSFSIAGYFLPLILRAKGVDTSRTVSETYRSYVWIYLPGVTAPLVSCYFMELPRLGRKWAMVLGAGLMGLSFALYQVVNSLPASIGLD